MLNSKIKIYEEILKKVEMHVTKMLEERLNKNLMFHNLTHTLDVVNAAKEIGRACKVSDKDCYLVVIAAWFHDTGYIQRYTGHEDASMNYATEFLHQMLSKEDLEKVLACIESTEMPQNPDSCIEEILCDADMYHLTRKDYYKRIENLREEWELVCDRKMRNDQWCFENLNFISQHEFFSPYGKEVLEGKKQKNVQKAIKKLDESICHAKG